MGYSEKWVRPDYQLYISPSYQGVLIGIDDMNLLQTLTASNSPSLTTTVALSSVYDRYRIVLEGILPGQPSVQTRLRVNVGGVQTTNYIGTITTNLAAADTATTFIPITGSTQLVSTSTPGINGILNLWQPWDTAAPKWVNGNVAYWNATNAINAQADGFYNGGNGAVSAVELSVSSSNILSGTMKLYGIYGT